MELLINCEKNSYVNLLKIKRSLGTLISLSHCSCMDILVISTHFILRKLAKFHIFYANKNKSLFMLYLEVDQLWCKSIFTVRSTNEILFLSYRWKLSITDRLQKRMSWLTTVDRKKYCELSCVNCVLHTFNTPHKCVQFSGRARQATNDSKF